MCVYIYISALGSFLPSERGGVLENVFICAVSYTRVCLSGGVLSFCDRDSGRRFVVLRILRLFEGRKKRLLSNLLAHTGVQRRKTAAAHKGLDQSAACSIIVRRKKN